MNQKEKYYVLIDESGDLGINKGTRWFVLSAVIIKETDEKLIRNRLKAITSQYNLNTIHLREIREFNKKASIVIQVSDLPFVYTNVLIDTSALDPMSPFLIYNYACRILLERVSWYLRDENGYVDVILSARSTKRDGELIEYITDKLLTYENNSIVSETINRVMSKQANLWDMLQLADICATSMFLAYDINPWGFRTPCFARRLKHHLYTYNGRLDNYGLKFYNDKMRPSNEYMRSNLISEI